VQTFWNSVMTHTIRAKAVLVGLIMALLFSGCARQPGQKGTGPLPREIKVKVNGEYSPGRIKAKLGQPLRLLFYREEDSDCTAQVVFPELKITTKLAVKQETPVELVPEKEGEFTFVCGMDMIQGKLVVER